MFTEAGFGDLVSKARAGTPKRDVLAASPIELAASAALIGSREEIGARLHEYEEACVDEIGFVPGVLDDSAGARTLAAVPQG